MGFLPEAIRNYLLRLGWAHGDDEIISTEQAIEWFDTNGLGKSPSRFDMVKLTNLSGHYIREADNERLAHLVTPLVEQKLGHPISQIAEIRLIKGMNGLKQRAKTLLELADNAAFYAASLPLTFTDKAEQVLKDGGKALAGEVATLLEKANDWSEAALEEVVKNFAIEKDIKLGNVAQAIRVSLTGSTISPSVFDMLAVLGKEESLARLRAVQ
jgi:glutamyl-tRNA synthetase